MDGMIVYSVDYQVPDLDLWLDQMAELAEQERLAVRRWEDDGGALA